MGMPTKENCIKPTVLQFQHTTVRALAVSIGLAKLSLPFHHLHCIQKPVPPKLLMARRRGTAVPIVRPVYTAFERRIPTTGVVLYKHTPLHSEGTENTFLRVRARRYDFWPRRSVQSIRHER